MHASVGSMFCSYCSWFFIILGGQVQEHYINRLRLNTVVFTHVHLMEPRSLMNLDSQGEL
jgi:hypothetical protein